MANKFTPENCPNRDTHGNPFRYCATCSWTEPPECGWPIRNGMQVLGCPRPASEDGLCPEHARLQARWRNEAQEFAKAVTRAALSEHQDGGDG